MAEPLTLAEVKAYLRVLTNDEDAKITAMIPRARLWVEDHTGLALVQRQFTERLRPLFGTIRLGKGPLVTVDSIDYLDSAGGASTYTALAYPPSTTIQPASGESWPGLAQDEAFAITYTAGYATDIDDRLIGAMYALIEGEFSAGHAYPQGAIDAAERCCAYLRQMVA